MISGRLALNRGHERTSRWMPNEGESVFPSNRQQEIYTIDHTRFPLLPSPPPSLSITILPHRLFFGYARRTFATLPWQNSGFSGGVSCVKATARSADFSRPTMRSYPFAERLSVCPFARFQDKVRSRFPPLLTKQTGFVIPIFCSLQSDIAWQRRRIMSIR